MGHQQINPYQTPWNDAYAPFAAQAQVDERTAFIRRTYAHVFGAVALFTAIETVLLYVVPAAVVGQALTIFGPYTWLAFLGGFMVVSWVARGWAQSSTSKATQYAGLGLYVVGEAVIMLPLLFMAVHFTQDPKLLPTAAFITLFMFGGLTVVTLFTKQDFSFLGSMLWWGGLAAMGAIVCAIVFGFSLGVWFSVAMILLASGYILYDTSNVMHRYRTDQHVAAALALFASLALLFWYVLRLMMELNRR